MRKVSVVIPNWNGAEELPACLDSLLSQSLKPDIIVVENGSTDESLELLDKEYHAVEVVVLPKNLGFAGGVNAGIKRALEQNFEYIALLNNDAVADRNWINHLVDYLDSNKKVGIATSKMLASGGEYLDSTGDFYTTWGLPHPRGRRETEIDKYDDDTSIFAASGGASMYRAKMLEEIGLFDEDFFAYYEDVDLSFRAQLAGWEVAFVPEAKVRHQIGSTSRRVHGFATKQTLKNYPWLLWKNVPKPLLKTILPRFLLAYWSFYFSALFRGEGWAATQGMLKSLILLPKKLRQRKVIQKNMTVSASYINSMLVHDLPPNAHKLRRLRSMWWRLRRKA
jgi:GT2 family glycosyltransferase